VLAVRVRLSLTLNFGTTVDKLYLCAYGDESFAVYAPSLEQAHQKASGLNLSVVRELNKNEYEGL